MAMRNLEPLNDEQLLDVVVSEFARVTGLPVAFGGYLRGATTTVTAVEGEHTNSLHGLRVARGRGLGGRAMEELRPRFTPDYAHSRNITHDYDREILDAGIVSLVAIPIITAGATRAVLYGGSRANGELAGVFRRPVTELTESLCRELRVRDEVARRVPRGRSNTESPLPAPQLEELRASYAELRSASTAVTDPAVRARLTAVEERLARLSGAVPPPDGEAVRLTRRETDVLSQVALGSTNAEAGQALDLTEGTVKAYLKSASAKLGVSGRYAAVAAARRERLLP
ncbi:MAG: LuxR C-terminal-related transcriptional regulator [Leucobacter sp.]